MSVYRFDNEDGSCAFFHVRFLRKDGTKGFFYAYPASPLESDQTLTDPQTGLVVSVAKRMPSLACDLVYRLPELKLAIREHSSEIYCVEGEHDAETIREFTEYDATTGWGGAGKWGEAQARWFAGYQGVVNVVVDNDAPGAGEGVLKFDSLSALGVRVELYRPPHGCKDVSDFLAAGGDVGDLEEVERDELALLGNAWLTPSRKREWSNYDVSVSFLSRVLERTGR